MVKTNACACGWQDGRSQNVTGVTKMTASLPMHGTFRRWRETLARVCCMGNTCGHVWAAWGTRMGCMRNTYGLHGEHVRARVGCMGNGAAVEKCSINLTPACNH
eukprot:364482-Chlamydomonas_euryale.AAC.1